MRSIPAAALAIVLLAACGTSPTPSTTTPSATTLPTAGATTAPSLTTSAACPIAPQEGRLLSDRLTGLRLASSPAGDSVEFLFGPRSSAPTLPKGYLLEVRPPFAAGGSGLPIEVKGTRFVQVRFEGMYLYDDAGTATFTGTRDTLGTGPVAEVVVIDESEGYSTWIIGIRGSGCVSLGAPTSDELRVTVLP